MQKMRIGVIAYEIIECPICGHMTVRLAMPKHLRFVHGFTVEHALEFALPLDLRLDLSK